MINPHLRRLLGSRYSTDDYGFWDRFKFGDWELAIQNDSDSGTFEIRINHEIYRGIEVEFKAIYLTILDRWRQDRGNRYGRKFVQYWDAIWDSEIIGLRDMEGDEDLRDVFRRRATGEADY
jgi:hypothetical protein